IIFAGRLGSAPAVATLLTDNNRNVFMIFPPDCVTGSPSCILRWEELMSIRQVGILNYFRFWQSYRMPQGSEVWLISRALRATHPHPDSRRAASVRATSE